MARSEKCYFGTGTDKKLITVAQALDHRKRTGSFIGQCFECGSPVMANKGSAQTNMSPHFEHFKRNEACKLSDPHRSKKK